MAKTKAKWVYLSTTVTFKGRTYVPGGPTGVMDPSGKAVTLPEDFPEKFCTRPAVQQDEEQDAGLGEGDDDQEEQDPGMAGEEDEEYAPEPEEPALVSKTKKKTAKKATRRR